MRTLRIKVVAGLMAAALAACVRAEEGVTDKEILIGQTTMLTGSTAAHGEGLRDGALAYFNRINRNGGVHGRRIVLKTLDDGGDASIAAENTNKLIAQAKVFALFSGAEGGPCVASTKAATARKVPVVACAAGSPDLREPFNRYSLPVRAPHLSEFDKMIETGLAQGRKRVGFLHVDSDTGRKHLANARKLLAKHELELTAAIPIPQGKEAKPEPAKLAQAILDADLDMVFNHGSYAIFGQTLLEARKLGVTAQFMAVNSGAQQLVTLLGKHASGLIFTQVVPMPTKEVVPLVKNFQRDFRAQFDKPQSTFSHLEGYVNAMVLVEGLRRAGKDLTRERFIDAMQSIRDFDLGGMRVSYSKREHTGSIFVDTVMVAEDGRFVR